MDHSLRYGRERFQQARRVLEGRDLQLLRGYANTPNNRLRAAVLAVYACVRNHFASEEHYAAFSDLMFELRLLRPDGRVLRAIETLGSDDCVRLGRRLFELALRVGSRRLPGDPLHEAFEPAAAAQRRRSSTGS